jgi:hypothetical protein
LSRDVQNRPPGSLPGRFWVSANIFLKRHLIFRDENILVQCPTFEIEMKWDAFVSRSKEVGCYSLKMKNQTLIIPKSDIPDNLIPAFENLLRQKIDKMVVKPMVPN